MDLSDFEFELPRELIAQEAVEPRDAARLLVLDRSRPGLEHRRVADLPGLLGPGDLVVVNDTRVVPARLFARKESGGRVELLLLQPLGEAGEAGEAGEGASTREWRALVGASRVPRPGAPLELEGGFQATLLEEPDERGEAALRIEGPAPLEELMSAHGKLPLPPYIRRDPQDPRDARDRERYQTLFAERPGALAAPTAGLHFTEGLLAGLEEAGVELARITLHVGEGTFRTPAESALDRIELHREECVVSEQLADAVARTRSRGGRVLAVGTTTTRALESRPERSPGVPEPGSSATGLFIKPGHRFRFVDMLLTNFHLPGSTLIVLVAALAGRERVLEAYAEAVALRYRFFSYGDAMLVR